MQRLPQRLALGARLRQVEQILLGNIEQRRAQQRRQLQIVGRIEQHIA